MGGSRMRSWCAAWLLTLVSASMVLAQIGPPVTPGFPNVPQTPGTLISGLHEPNQGRTAIIAYHNGLLFTLPELPGSQGGSDYLARTWDLSDLTNPSVVEVLGQSPMPINAHGYYKVDSHLVLGGNGGPWTFRAGSTPGQVDRIPFPYNYHRGAGTRGTMAYPWFVGETWWSYGDIEGNAFIEVGWNRVAEWDHLGMTGVIGHPILIGDILIFAGDQTRTGVATYDVGDPANPVLLDVLTDGGPGGYWPEVWGGGGKLYIVFPYNTGGNGFRVVDATDPTDLQFVTDVALPGDSAMYAQFQDEYAFIADHKIDMRTFESVLFLDGANEPRTEDGGVGVSTSQFGLPLGNLWITGGIGVNQGMAIWAHQAAPDSRGPEIGFHFPRPGRTQFPPTGLLSFLIHETLESATLVNGETFILRPLGGAPVSGTLTFTFGDILTFAPDQPLTDNTTYEVVFPAGGIKDAAGNGIEGYSFTFSTGASVGGNAAPTIAAFQATPYPVEPAAFVSFQTDANDVDGGALEYRFDFGDGTPQTAWSTASTVQHAYVDAGHYRATVQTRDESGAIATDSLTVTVVPALTGPRPTHSAPIVCDEGRRRVWAIHPDNDTLAAIDADTLQLELEQQVCADPRSVAAAANGEIWVACHDDDRVVVLDSGGSLVRDWSLDYGSGAVAIALNPAGSTAYVALESKGQLLALDAATGVEIGRVDVGPLPRALAVSADGADVWVTRFLSDKDFAEVRRVETAALVVAEVRRLRKFGGELNRDTTASGRGVANHLAGIALDPHGNYAWIAANKANVERGTFFAEPLDSDNTLRNVAMRLGLSDGSMTAIDIDNSDSAAAVAFSPLGDYLFVALQGNDELLVIDALEGSGSAGGANVFTRLQVGAAPQGVCVDGTTGRTFVKNFIDRSITVLETEPMLRRGIKQISSTAVDTVNAERMAANVLRGKRIFYHASDPRMSAEGYISCASCHVDGSHDGRVWDFTDRGEGFRNTTSLRGRGGIDHGNVHWSGNFDEIQDFENDIRSAFGGSGFMDDLDFAATQGPLDGPKGGLSQALDDLADYVQSLDLESVPRSPFRQTDGSLTPSALSGRSVFANQECQSCHSGSVRTDSTLGSATLHDVGTLRTSSGGRLGGSLDGIDTPTLLGAWRTAPYLHDGSAATLESVFSASGGALLQAESGTLSGSANRVEQWVDLNYDNTVQGQSLVQLTGGSLTLAGVDGGAAGGLGAIELRYSIGWPTTVNVSVNGAPLAPLALQALDLEPQWRQTVWETVRIDDVALQAGPSNTVTIQSGYLGLDSVLVSNADDRAAAAPHRRVLDLPPILQGQLMDYLRQLDGRSDDGLQLERPGDLNFDPARALEWTPTAGADGYDVVTGDLATLLATGDFAQAVDACLADGIAVTQVDPGVDPAPGQGRWYLVRAELAAGPQSWDGNGLGQVGSRDAGIAAAATTCP